MSEELELLRWCLHGGAIPQTAYRICWHDLLEFAKKQAIVGVYWQGISQLGSIQTNKPTDDDVMEWMAAIQHLEKKNRKANEKAVWVSGTFLKEGFRSCLLKGQGNALLYPTPLWRQSGDIDIWVEGDDDTLIAYARRFVPKAKAVYHHVDFISTSNIEVELHYRPSWMSCPWYNRRLQQFFGQQRDSQMSHQVALGGGHIAVPTWQFNVVYQICHIYLHLLKEGIGLRQTIDYYYLLLNHGAATDEERREIGVLLRRLGLRHISGALMWLLHKVLGLDEEYLIAPMDSRRGRHMLHEMMASGNFGKYDERAMSGMYGSGLKHNIQRLWRDVRMVRYYPAECIWEPWFRIWHLFWRRRHNR